MKFLDVPMIAMVPSHLVSHTVENIQPPHFAMEGSPAVSEGKMSVTSPKVTYSIQPHFPFFLRTYIYLWRIKNHIRRDPEVWRIGFHRSLVVLSHWSHIVRRSYRAWITALVVQMTCLRGSITRVAEWLTREFHWGVTPIDGTASSPFALVFSLWCTCLLILLNNSAQGKTTLRWPQTNQLESFSVKSTKAN